MSRNKRKSAGRRSLNNIDAGAYDREEEILGFSPVTLIDDVINAVHDYACDIVDDIQEDLAVNYPDHTEELSKAFDKVLDIWTPALDRYLDKFELYALQNSFTVPKGIKALDSALLQKTGGCLQEKSSPEDTSLPPELLEKKRQLDKEDQRLEKQLEALRKHVLEASYELEVLKERDEQLAFNEPDMLAKFCKPNGSGEMDEEFEDLLNNVADLQQLLAILPEAPDARPTKEQVFLAHQSQTSVSSGQEASSFAQKMSRRK